MPACLSDAKALKKEGNAAFSRGAYAAAVTSYTAAIDLWMEPNDRAILYTNRSAARLKLAGEKQKARADAERAIQLDPAYAKGHFRHAQALRALGDAHAAVGALTRVLELVPGDKAAEAELAELKLTLQGPTKPSLAGASHAGGAARVPTSASEPSPFAATKPAPAEPNTPFLPEDAHAGRGGEARAATQEDFVRRAAERLAEDEKANPPPSEPAKPEVDTYLGIAMPPGFGPNAPGWDPSTKNWIEGVEDLTLTEEQHARLEEDARRVREGAEAAGRAREAAGPGAMKQVRRTP